MGILDAYQDSTDTALRVMATQPLTPEPVTPKHSTWSAPFRAVAAGAAEVAGNVIDTAAAAGQVAASAGGITPGFDPDQAKNRQASLDAMDKMKADGINWRTDEGQQAYKFGADLRPDPLTAGTAENLVFSLTKGLTKAIGAAATLGPVGGAAAFGVSEGLTTAEDLANQGVDQQTRSKVGAVTGAMSAAGVVLPVAGKTLATTVGLVAVGGPLSFMTQQQATRSILEAADYHDIAKQYDPLDPVGLTVATLVPAGFAAAARAGARGAAKPLETGTKAPETAPETVPQTPDIVPTRDDIDAAMVHNLTTLRDVHEATPPEKFAAELWRGQVTENPNFKAWFGDSKVVGEDGSPMVVYHGTGADIQQFNVSERGEFGGGIYLTPDTTGASDYAMYRAQGPANVMPVYVSIRNPAGAAEASQVASWKGEENARAELIRRGYDGVIDMRSGQIVAFRPEQIKSAIGNSGKFDPNSGSLTDRIEPTAPAKPAEDVTPELYRARVEQLATEQPDLVARLDDAGQPVRLADELAAVRKAAQEGTDTEFGALDAPLLKVAAECALATGTAAL